MQGDYFHAASVDGSPVRHDRALTLGFDHGDSEVLLERINAYYMAATEALFTCDGNEEHRDRIIVTSFCVEGRGRA